MADLQVGEKECSFPKVAGCFNTTTTKSVVEKKWKELGRLLGVEEVKLDSLRKDSTIYEKLQTVDVVMDILADWKMKAASEATLGNLIGVVEAIEMMEVSKTLKQTFGVESNKKKAEQDCTIVHFDDQEVLDFIESKKPLQVEVELPGDAMTFKDHYDLPASGKGLALIINIVEFQNPDLGQRHGSENDLEYMSELWAQLGYELFPKIKSQREKSSWEKSEIVHILEQFKERIAKSKPKSIVVFIGSHGGHQKIYTSDKPYNRDPVSLDVYQDIVSIFGESACPILKGRPKIFIVNTCQAFDGIDNYSNKSFEATADTFIWTAQVPGAEANRDTEKGSWFAFCVAYIFMRYAHKRPLQDMCNMVGQMMKKIMSKSGGKQLPVSSSIQMEKLYFTLDP